MSSKWPIGIAAFVAGAAIAAVAAWILLDDDEPSATSVPVAAPITTVTTLPADTTVTQPPATSLVTTTVPATTTTQVPVTSLGIAWTETEAERDVANYLAALAAGAWEQAAWSVETNGLVADGQSDDETFAEFIERLCVAGTCQGPYLVEADGPGVVDPEFFQASSTVTVIHEPSGTTGSIGLGTFEGQRVISELPPLVDGPRSETLVQQLFAGDAPERVVIQRFNAFEIWEDGSVRWVTHWLADDVFQVEGDVVALFDGVADLGDPATRLVGECPSLLVRDGRVLVLDRCFADEAALLDPESGEVQDLPVSLQAPDDGVSVIYAERGGVVVTGLADAEGNAFELETLDGVDLLEEDYAGILAIATDGEHIAYVDHADDAALSHFWSPVVVVREVATGNKVLRAEIGNPVMCLEFAANWVVACEADDGFMSGSPEQQALVAIDIRTSESVRVETPVRLFLPA